MGKVVLDFMGFTRIFEGGNAIKSSRRIKESEFAKTLESIKRILFPILGIDPAQYQTQYIIIGSIGKKKNPEETSGDIDLGYNSAWFSAKEGIDLKECSKKIYETLTSELGEVLGFDPEIKNMPGLNIVSIGWPIEGDSSKGTVQLDLIPVQDITWAEFIFYSPNYKTDESKYKSAHRNWLFSAILAARKEVLSTDINGEIMEYDSPVLVLSNGLFWHRKSYKGKLKDRLKNPKKVEGSERFITRDPQEFLDFSLGEGYSPMEVKSFEDLFNIITSSDFELYDKLPQIKEKYIGYLERAGLPIPLELSEIK